MKLDGYASKNLGIKHLQVDKLEGNPINVNPWNSSHPLTNLIDMVKNGDECLYSGEQESILIINLLSVNLSL